MKRILFTGAALVAVVLTLLLGGTVRAAGITIGPGDILQVTVLQQPDRTQEVRVGQNGEILLSLIGQVPAAGQDCEALARAIAACYAEFIHNPQVTVSVKEFHRREITVAILGAVRSPGRYRVPEHTTILDLLSQAGGITEEHGGQLVVLRPASAAEARNAQEITVNVRDLFTPEGLKDRNIELDDGDTVNVLRAEHSQITVAILGEVRSPGRYRVPEHTTLLDLLSQVGGITEEHGGRLIVLHPGNPAEKRDAQEIIINAQDLFTPSGLKDRNIELSDGDTVHVPRADRYYVFGEVVRPGAYKLEKGAKIDVQKAIGLAGGFTEIAARKNLKITREIGGSKSVLKATMETEVLPQDIIDVPERFF